MDRETEMFLAPTLITTIVSDPDTGQRTETLRRNGEVIAVSTGPIPSEARGGMKNISESMASNEVNPGIAARRAEWEMRPLWRKACDWLRRRRCPE